MLSLRHKISPLARSVNTAAAQKQVEEVYLVSSARTPLGSMGGKLKKLKATELGSTAIKSCLDVANVDPSEVEEVFMGCVIQVGTAQILIFQPY